MKFKSSIDKKNYIFLYYSTKNNNLIFYILFSYFYIIKKVIKNYNLSVHTSRASRQYNFIFYILPETARQQPLFRASLLNGNHMPSTFTLSFFAFMDTEHGQFYCRFFQLNYSFFKEKFLPFILILVDVIFTLHFYQGQ